MTADFTYGTYAVYDPITDTVDENATGGKFVLVKDGAAQPIYDLNGTPISQITSNASGQSIQFRADAPNGLIQFGTLAVTVFCNEVGTMAVAAYNAIAGLAALSSLQTQLTALQTQVNSLGTGGVAGATLVGNEFRLIDVGENSDGSYPTKPTGMAAYERIRWIGRNSPKDLGIGVAGDHWSRLPS